jgi:uncharacterized Tic20 family protein
MIPPPPSLSHRFNPPPGWPSPPPGWTPPQGWAPDPSWPPPPYGWQWWIDGTPYQTAQHGNGVHPRWCTQTRNSSDPAMWAHLGALLTWLAGLIIFAPLSLFCFVVPLILRSNHHDDPFVRHHATQALNSALTGLFLWIPAIVLIGLALFGGGGVAGGAVLVILAAIFFAVARAVCEIIGSVKAHNGERFPFPMWVAFRFVKDDSISSPTMDQSAARTMYPANDRLRRY